MQEPKVPSHYLVSRTANVDTLIQLLFITPPYCSIITDAKDVELALQLASEVIRANDLQHAHQLAIHINKQTDRCPIIIGDTDLVDSFYAKEEEEQVCPGQ